MSDTAKRHSYFPRPSGPSVFITLVVIIGCFLALALVVNLTYRRSHGPRVSVDISQVSEDQRWRYTPEGRKARLAEMRANEADLLGTYGWVDQSAGIVRVPVGRAMELIVKEQEDAGAR